MRRLFIALILAQPVMAAERPAYAPKRLALVRQVTSVDSSPDGKTVFFVTDITGATVTLDKNGTWVVVGIFEFIHSGTDGTQRGYLDYNGATQTGNASHLGSATAEKATVAQVWFLTVTGQPKVAKLRADKSSGASSSTCEATNTTINAVFLKA